MTGSSLALSLPAVEAARLRAGRAQRLVAILTIVVPSVGTLLAIGLLPWLGLPPASVFIATAVMYVATVLGVTVGYHRHFTHRAFDAPAPVRTTLGVLGSMAAQGPLLFWVAEHRAHHQFADREGDPHSPVTDSLWHAHVGWMLDESPADLGRYAVDLLRDRPSLWINQTYFAWVIAGVLAPAALVGLAEGSLAAAAMGALWAGLVRIFLVHHATWAVNSICHRFGKRPHPTRDGSTNHWLVAFFSLGEGWHNNHHAFPASARHGLGAWQLDPSWWTIRLLSAAGLATQVRTPGPKAQGGVS
jgi:stearoyl-CoA desaturase (delta-9 desaturase)